MSAAGGEDSITSTSCARPASFTAKRIVIQAGPAAVAGAAASSSAGSTGNAARFVNLSGSGTLSAPNGRWLIYATNPLDSANFQPGSLDQDFTQYAATPGTGVRGSGMAMGIGQAMAVGFFYWSTHSVAIALGRGGALAPMLAGWMANLVFLTFGFYLLLKVRY